jgi:hypothetical protein
MQIISGYFINKGIALETADYLRKHGIKGSISVIGQRNEEDNRENNNIEYTGEQRIPGVELGMAGFIVQGNNMSGQTMPIAGMFTGLFGSGITGTLEEWGVPEEEGEEIRRVIESGNSVILVESDGKDKSLICDILKNKGAQNIH